MDAAFIINSKQGFVFCIYTNFYLEVKKKRSSSKVLLSFLLIISFFLLLTGCGQQTPSEQSKAGTQTAV